MAASASVSQRRVWAWVALMLILTSLALWVRTADQSPAPTASPQSAPVAETTAPALAEVSTPAQIATTAVAKSPALKASAPVVVPTINPKIAATTQTFKPFAQAQTHAELIALLESFPARDRTAFQQAVVAPVSQWCAAVWSSYFDQAAFQRQTPGRYRAILQLREFCGSAPSQPVDTVEPTIIPLGSALLGFYARAANRAGGDTQNLFDLGVSLQQRYRSGRETPPADLGCEFGCAGAFSAATMVLACGTVGGCGPRSALALGFCATGFIPEGCRKDADYVTALRDRYSYAEWRRVEWAIGVMAKELQ